MAATTRSKVLYPENKEIRLVREKAYDDVRATITLRRSARRSEESRRQRLLSALAALWGVVLIVVTYVMFG